MTATNWDQELKRIEREFQGLSPDPVIKLDNARAAAERHALEQRRARSAAIGAWVRVALVVALAGGMYFWPYPRACGVGLFSWMGAAALVGIGALWGAVASWRSRLPAAHGGAMIMVIASLALLASQVLPRVGYAKVPPGASTAWRCPPGP